jgi:hypothetical protein
LEIPAETAARTALEELENNYSEDKARLKHDLEQARREAEPVRSGLLYGTGNELVAAVATVLRAAGFTVTDLDQELGGTRSADLLAVLGGQVCLIEVKSASGSAPESLASHLERHRDTWPQLRPGQPVTCAALIVNHQHKLDPANRTQDVYQRREFIETLAFPALATRDIFEWWRDKDWTAVRTGVLGSASASAGDAPQTSPPRRLWSRRSRTPNA